MAAQSFDFTLRQAARARVTAEAALAAPATEQVALKTLAPNMISQCDAMTAADDAVKAAEHTAKQEVAEGSAALNELRSVYDQVREVSAAKLGITYEAASAFRTPDDLLNVAEDLEDTLGRGDPTWAEAVLASYSPVLEAASKEYYEASRALKKVQEVALAREQAEGQFRPVLVRFRRAVRATSGSRSRQYRELLDRRSRKGEPDDPASGGESPTP